MPKPPQVKARQLLRALERLGFLPVRQKGSHVQMKKGNLLATVPMHSGDLNPETLRSIIRQARITVEELVRNL